MSGVARFERFADGCRRLLARPAWCALAVWLALAALLLPARQADPDLFARVAMGRLVERDGGVPSADPFAYTPRHDWVDHEWLTGVAFWQVAKRGGDAGLHAAKLVLLLGSVGLLVAAARTYSGTVQPLWLLLGLSYARYVWGATLRSQVFTYLFLPLFLLAFARWQRARRGGLLFALPVAMALWANFHGGFVVGLGLLGIVTAVTFGTAPGGRRVADALPLAVTLVACVAATFANPYGASYWDYVLRAVTMPRPEITEWAPVDVLGVEGVVPNLFVVLLVVGVAVGTRRREPLALTLLAVSAVYGYRHLRLVAIFLMVAIVYGADLMSAGLARLGRGLGARRIAIERMAAVLLVAAAPVFAFRLGAFAVRPAAFALDYGVYPVAALEWLRTSEPGGNVLCDFNVGSYALWRLHPAFRISVDGRYEEVYPEATVHTVHDALNVASPTQAASLAVVPPDFVLLHAGSHGHRNWQAFGPAWHLVYEDPKWAILATHPPTNGTPAGPPPTVRPTWSPTF